MRKVKNLKIKKTNKIVNIMKKILNYREHQFILDMSEYNEDYGLKIDRLVVETNKLLDIKGSFKTEEDFYKSNEIKELKKKYYNFMGYAIDNLDITPELINFVELYTANNLICKYADIKNIVYKTTRSELQTKDYFQTVNQFNIELNHMINDKYQVILPELIQIKIEKINLILSEIINDYYFVIPKYWNVEKTKKEMTNNMYLDVTCDHKCFDSVIINMFLSKIKLVIPRIDKKYRTQLNQVLDLMHSLIYLINTGKELTEC